MMVVCCVCRRDVQYNEHWSSTYKKAKECIQCRRECDLVCLPSIIQRICQIQTDFALSKGIFSHASACPRGFKGDHVYDESGHCIWSDPASLCFLAFENIIETRIERFIWDAFNAAHNLEKLNKIQYHELDSIKQYFVRNMPSFVTRENIALTDSMNLFETMKI